MNCKRCHTTLTQDVNRQWECPSCGDRPGPLRDADLEAMDTPAVAETLDELQARHDERIAAAAPGVTRRIIVMGPGPKKFEVDERDAELEKLRAQVHGLMAELARVNVEVSTVRDELADALAELDAMTGERNDALADLERVVLGAHSPRTMGVRRDRPRHHPRGRPAVGVATASVQGGGEVKILRRINVPTGDILIVQGQHGPLECLSLGDYGKEVNIKCDALGLSRDPDPVRHTQLLPLTEKWVATISTQYGCSMGCAFCDVPKVGPGRNASEQDMIRQVLAVIGLHPEVRTTARLNIHFARMGEPSWNPNVLDATRWFKTHIDPEFHIHPVVSTMMPRRNEWLKTFIHTWMRMKNRLLDGEAGLQLSINSTDENERAAMFNGNALTLDEIARLMDGIIPKGRKITLNFAVAGYEIDPAKLLRYFSPDDYLIKLTPMHETVAAITSGIHTCGDYTTIWPYSHHEAALKAAGYDVLVFIASHEEDSSRITCGNAILSDAADKPADLFAEIAP